MAAKEMNSPEVEKFFEYLLSLPHNNKCADCGMNGPTWCAFTYGFLICYECAGQHRKLGQNQSRVKSVTMDTWSTEELRRIYVGGNKFAYKISTDPDIAIKYKDCGAFVAELDRRCKDSREKEPGDSFMKAKKKPTSIGFGSAVIKKKAVPKFSDNVSKRATTSTPEPLLTNDACVVRSSKEEPADVSTETLSDVALLSRKTGVTSSIKMPKNVAKSRSPFSFKPESQSEEEE